ncbi:MAG: glutamate--tRNA ligase [Myxococcota bacterium]|nr:glutamate--tRNA ligase [Myxococcota bacterium]
MITRCRFAPSPTGRLHVGGARTALFNLLFARHSKGRMVLRIEDTDRVRSTLASEEGISEDLRWLGLLWDEGPALGGPGAPYRQSERLEIYRAQMQLLLEQGLLYEAWETPEELTAMRQEAQAAKQSFHYRGGKASDEAVAAYRAEGRKPVLRFQTSGADVEFSDAILGDIKVPGEDVDDFVVCKADGFPTYHFAVVVDDHEMQVSHVLRAQEHLMNTAKHLLLYRAFGWEMPVHAHMPLIFSMAGSKMSKRDKAKAARAAVREAGLDAAGLAEATGIDADEVQRFLKKKTDDVGLAEQIALAVDADLPEIDVIDFRRAGYLPEALVNFLALLGWSPGDDREIMTFEEMSEAFTLNRVGRTAARFDREKLRWMNGMYIRAASEERIVSGLRDYFQFVQSPLADLDDEALGRVVVLYKERAQTLEDFCTQSLFFFEAPTAWGPAKAIRKHLLKGDGRQRLSRSLECLAAVDSWEEAVIEAALVEQAESDCEGRLGPVAQPIRIALTGTTVSPPIFTTLELLGQDASLSRIQACLDHHADMSLETTQGGA